MKQKISLVQQNNKSQAGFSMLESIVAGMISLIFMSMGANLVVAANMQKIIAKRNVAMNNFVQSDLDGIKYQATILERDNDMCNPTNATNGYAAALKQRLGEDNSASSFSETTVKALDRNYTMTRTLSYDTTLNSSGLANNSRILKVDYKFTYGNGTDTTIYYRLYSEVLPTVASRCA